MAPSVPAKLAVHYFVAETRRSRRLVVHKDQFVQLSLACLTNVTAYRVRFAAEVANATDQIAGAD